MPQPDFRAGTLEAIRSWVEALVDDKVSEGFTLDYKKEIQLTPKGRLDLVRDITAFANTNGGVVLVGVDEDRSGQNPGIPKGPIGIEPISGFVQRINDSVADNVHPRLTGLVIREIEVERDKVIYACWVPESNSGPHMVQREDGFQFVHRTQMRVESMTEAMVRDAYQARRAREDETLSMLTGNDIKLLETRRIPRLQARFAAIPRLSVEGLVPIASTRELNVLREGSRILSPVLGWEYTSFGAQSYLPTDDEEPSHYCRFYDSGASVVWARVREYPGSEQLPRRMIDVRDLFQLFANFARFVTNTDQRLGGPKNYVVQLLLRTYGQSAWVHLGDRQPFMRGREISSTALPEYPDQLGVLFSFNCDAASEHAVENIVRQALSKFGRYVGDNEFETRLSVEEGQLVLDLGFQARYVI